METLEGRISLREYEMGYNAPWVLSKAIHRPCLHELYTCKIELHLPGIVSIDEF